MLIDLTMPMHEGMASHPYHGRTPVFLSGTIAHDRYYARVGQTSGYDGALVSFQNANVCMSDHTGTHMDAPLHADPAGAGIDAIALEHGLGPAVWLDLSKHFGDGAQIGAEDLERAEADGREAIRSGDILLVWTGWSTVLPDRERYLAAHMGLTRDAAEWIRARGVRTLGIDTSTPDVAGATEQPVHMNFLRPDCLGGDDPVIAIVENLVNISSIPTRRFAFRGLPLPLQGLTGSPLRAVAEVR